LEGHHGLWAREGFNLNRKENIGLDKEKKRKENKKKKIRKHLN
jgi:hypothetical protein